MAHLEKPPIALGFSYDGVDDFVEVPHDVSLEPNRLTIAFRIRVKDTGTWQALVRKDETYGAPDEAFSLSIGYTFDFFRFEVYTTVLNTLDASFSLVEDAWYHLAVVYDGSEMRIYVNGNLIGSKPATGDIYYSAHYVLWLGKYVGLLMFKGVMDDVRIYNRALSADEISDLYNVRRNITDGCVMKLGALGLVRGGGTQWLDEGAYKNHGTVYGAKRVRCCHCNPVVNYGT